LWLRFKQPQGKPEKSDDHIFISFVCPEFIRMSAVHIIFIPMDTIELSKMSETLLDFIQTFEFLVTERALPVPPTFSD